MSITEAPRTAAIYCRMSLDKQGTGLGLERQEAECRAFCERNALEVVAVHGDNDMSATKGLTRPGFEAMFTTGADVWVTWATDRLVRRTSELLRVIEAGPTVHTVQAGLIDLATPSGRMVGRMLTAVAELEGEQRTARQQLALRQRAEHGKPWWPQRPFGQELDGSLHAEEAPLLQQACADLLRGVTLTEVAKGWNAKGLLKPGGSEWTGQAVRTIILKPRVAGLRTYRGQIVGPGSWEPVVPEPTWRGVVAMLNDPARPRSPKGKRGSAGGRTPRNLLTNIATCERCGAYLTAGPNVVISGYGTEPVQTYFCPKGGHARVPREWLEGVVLRELWTVLPHFASAWPGRTNEGAEEAALALRAEQVTLKGRLAELGEAFANGELPMAALQAGADKAQERLTAVDLELEATAVAFTALDAVKDFEYVAQAFDSELSLGQQRQLVAQVFESIIVRGRGSGSRVPFSRDQVALVPRKLTPARRKSKPRQRPAVTLPDGSITR